MLAGLLVCWITPTRKVCRMNDVAVGNDAAREDRAIAALRAWLAVNLDGAMTKGLARSYGLSVVCVRGLIKDEQQRRSAERPTTPDPVVDAEPDPLIVGEDAFLAYLRAGMIDPVTDTLNSLAQRYGLSHVYLTERLHEIGLTLRTYPRKGPA